MVRKTFSEDTMDSTVPVDPDARDQRMADLFGVVEGFVEDSETQRSDWEKSQEKWFKLRMRRKKAKTFPFKGSSNLRMPTAEKNIRKIKAGVMGIIFGTRPIVQVLPSPSTTLERAQKIEKFLDHLVMNVIKIENIAEIAVDQSLEKGFSFIKPFWRREVIEREENFNLEEMALADAIALLFAQREQVVPLVIQRFDIDMHNAVADENLRVIQSTLDDIVDNGRTKVTFVVKDVVYDFPDVAYISPERVYVPVKVQETVNITHELFVPLEQIKRDAERKGYDKSVINALEGMRNINVEDKDSDVRKDEKEGIERIQNPSGLVRMWETYGWFDVNGDGNVEKSLITSFPDFKLIARAVKLNNLSGKYPFVKLFYELNDDRWFAHRGVPEMLEDIIKEIDVQHNMKIDAQTIRNAPMFVYRSGMINPNLVRMIPNQGIPVNGLQPLGDTIQALNFHNPNVEFSYEREQQLLNLEVQETVGQVDFSLQSVINKRQPRTLGEVQQQVAATGQVFSMDAKHYITGFSELFNMILELWSQFGPDSYEFTYFGNNSGGETIKLTKEEVQNKYTIIVRGNDQSLNPNVKIAKADRIFAFTTNPLLIQLGIVSPQHIANALKRSYQAMDIEAPEDLMNSQPQPVQDDPKKQIDPRIFEKLTEEEQAQVIAALGIRPDINDRQRRRLQDIIVDSADAASKIGSDGGGNGQAE